MKLKSINKPNVRKYTFGVVRAKTPSAEETTALDTQTFADMSAKGIDVGSQAKKTGLDIGGLATGAAALGSSIIDVATMNDAKPSKGASTAKGAMSGFASTAGIGLNPATLAATGGLSALIPVATGVIGGTLGFFQGKGEEDAYNKQKKAEETAANLERKQAYDSSSQYNQASAANRGFMGGGKEQSSFYGKNGGLLKSIKYLQGGELQPVSKNTQLAVGQSHENGGIKLDAKSEIEGGETLVDKGDHTLVVSDNLVNPLSGNTFAKDDLKLAKTLGRFEGKTSNLAKNSIKQINAKREVLHDIQQKMNGDATDEEQNQNMAENGMKLNKVGVAGQGPTSEDITYKADIPIAGRPSPIRFAPKEVKKLNMLSKPVQYPVPLKPQVPNYAENGMKMYGDGGKTTKKQYINIADKYHDIEKRGQLDSLFNTPSGKAYHSINQKVFGSVNKRSPTSKRSNDKSKNYSNFKGNPADRFPASRDSSGYEDNSELYSQKERAKAGIDEYIKGNTLNIVHIDNGRVYDYNDSYDANRAKEVQKDKDVVKAKPAVKIPIAENKKQPVTPTVKPPIVKTSASTATTSTPSKGNIKTNSTGGRTYTEDKQGNKSLVQQDGTYAQLPDGKIRYKAKGSNTWKNITDSKALSEIEKMDSHFKSPNVLPKPTDDDFGAIDLFGNPKVSSESIDVQYKRVDPTKKVTAPIPTEDSDALDRQTQKDLKRILPKDPRDYSSLKSGASSLAKLATYTAPALMDYANQQKNIARLKGMKVPDAPQQGFVNLAKQDMEVDRADIRKQQANYNAGISGTLADSQTAALMKANVAEQSANALSRVNQAQRNANIQTSNAQTEMNLGIDARNKAGKYGQAQQQMEKDVDISNRTADTTSKLISDVRNVQNTYRQEKYADAALDVDLAGMSPEARAEFDRSTKARGHYGRYIVRNGGKLSNLTKSRI